MVEHCKLFTYKVELFVENFIHERGKGVNIMIYKLTRVCIVVVENEG